MACTVATVNMLSAAEAATASGWCEPRKVSHSDRMAGPWFSWVCALPHPQLHHEIPKSCSLNEERG